VNGEQPLPHRLQPATGHQCQIHSQRKGSFPQSKPSSKPHPVNHNQRQGSTSPFSDGARRGRQVVTVIAVKTPTTVLNDIFICTSVMRDCSCSQSTDSLKEKGKLFLQGHRGAVAVSWFQKVQGRVYPQPLSLQIQRAASQL